MKNLVFGFFLLSGVCSSILGAADPHSLGRWGWRYPVPLLPSGGVGASYIDGLHYTYGTRGKITVEEKGQFPHPTTEATVRSVERGDPYFLAVGDYGLIWQRGASGPWNPIPAPTTNRLNSVTFAQGKWLAVGHANTILYSADRTNWNAAPLPPGFPSFDAHKAIFALNRFFIFGVANPDSETPRGLIASSTDGMIWQRVDVPEVATLIDAVTSDTGIAAVGYNGALLYSENGANWVRPWQAEDPAPEFVGAAWGLGNFVALARDGFALYSTNGTAWSPIGEWNEHPLRNGFDNYFDILFAADIHAFHVFLQNSAGRRDFSRFPTTSFGATQHPRYNYFSAAQSPTGTTIAAFQFSESWGIDPNGPNNLFGPFSLSRIENDVVLQLPGRLGFFSRGWAEELGPDFESEKIVQAQNSFVAITRNGEIHYSTNIYDWTRVLAVPEAEFNAIALGNDSFVASGRTLSETEPQQGFIYRSSDGRTWSRTLASDIILRDVAFGAGVFTAVGYRGNSGISLVSSNGQSWTESAPLNGLPFYNVAAGAGLFVASAFSTRPEVFASRNGLTWLAQQCTMDNQVNEIAFIGKRFVLLGPGAEFLESSIVLEDETSLQIGPALNGIEIQISSRFPYLDIETSADLHSWNILGADTNRIPSGLPIMPTPPKEITKMFDARTNGTNGARYYRARLPY